MNILETIRSRFTVALASLCDDPAPYADMIRQSQDPAFGDYQANCAMPLARIAGRPPREVAQQLIDAVDLSDLCEPPEIAGPGFINLRVRDDRLREAIEQARHDERLGVPTVPQPRTIVVDFSSPNVAKPMHVGHLRSTVIGDALVRVLRFLGHHVISDNHIGDWGTQFGMIIYGYKHFLDQEAFDRDAVAELARLYRLVNQLSDYHDALAAIPRLEHRLATAQQQLDAARNDQSADPKEQKKRLKKLRSDVAAAEEELQSLRGKVTAVESQPELHALAQQHPGIARLAREETARLHAGDEENRRLWENFLPKCLAALDRIYERLGISFDKTLGESFYDPMLADVVRELQQKGLARESDGAQCVFVEGNDAPFIVQKADGAYTYATTDLATIRYRVEQLQADEILYVVDHRQSEHFKLLFATAGLWGYDNVTLRHVQFGTVMGKDNRPYKTRSGDTVGLEGLLDEAVARAYAIVSESDDAKTDETGQPAPELDHTRRQQIAEIVGLGGIKYADLKHNRESDYVFDYDKMLALRGDTATYLQYAHARLCGIFRKGAVDRSTLSGEIILQEPAERALALKLCQFSEALTATAAEAKPNLLTQYLFELAGALTAFYEQCSVLKAETDQLRNSRLALVDLTGRILSRGLDLLGIAAPERM